MSAQTLNPQFRNAAEFIEFHCSRFADQPAYHCLGQTLTFAELEEKSRNLAKWLQHECGLQQGDRIAIQLPNLIQYPIAAYAALRAGLIVVNTNPLYTPREMKHQFTDAGVKALVIFSDALERLESIKADTELEHILVTGPADLIKPPAETKHGYHDFVGAIEKGTRLPDLQPVKAAREDIAVLQYTGGTTGVAKGAALTHANILANAAQMDHRIGQRCTEGEEIFVCPLPLYHIYAFTVNMLALFSMGSMNILIPNPRDLDGFVKAIQPFRFTGLAGINTLFVGLCRHPQFQQLDFSSLKVTFSGGAALTSAAAKLWQETTGCPVTEGWGLSETSPVATLNNFGAEELGTVGAPLIETKVEAWDEAGNRMPVGEVGELVISGPQVMQGYWQRPEETAKVMQNGFFRTGDMGLVQANGNIKIVDRLKDMIIVSGFNVYPNEVEDVLSRHPQIVEAAVVGAPDDKTGEAVCAHVVLSEEVSTQEIIDFCRQELTAYKVPRHVIVHSELPKSTVGKILRRELRDQKVTASA
ncbi:AMP-binding protein [Microbulbifer magnicolonia]|uniref:AMP-binding protein n=1 Tax=Microbulbifer magnicolonia TaxID=3109744 RepID=UPI002B409269|nr:AMP-binding protein [Microbulbifer sp. GG15]